MEFTTNNSTHEELADALRGVHGKDVGKDFAFIYLGQGVIGMADNTATLDKHVGVDHYSWIQLADKVWVAVCR